MIGDRTAVSPIAGLRVSSRPNRRSINHHSLGQRGEHRPRVVLLSADWVMQVRMPRVLEKLNATIEKLRSMGIKRVFVVGQVPIWKKPLYKILIGGSWDKIPERTFTGITDVFEV